MTGPKPKTRMRAPERREQLLDVTTQIVARQGFQKVTVEAVAQGAGVTRAVIYQHFGDLQDLLDAVVEREMERALSQVIETELTRLTEGPPVELMLESLSSYLHTVRSHPTTWRLVLIPLEGAPDILRQRIEEGRAAVLENLVSAVRPVLEATGQESGDAELTARLLSTISDEYARLVLADPLRYPIERLLQHARWFLEKAQLT
jgi:AcrR family transcriptional regulator